jgi:hypothetical protein
VAVAEDAKDAEMIAPPLSALSIAVPQPVITSTLSQNSGGLGFDKSIGNYTTEATDAQVSSVGPARDVTRPRGRFARFGRS